METLIKIPLIKSYRFNSSEAFCECYPLVLSERVDLTRPKSHGTSNQGPHLSDFSSNLVCWGHEKVRRWPEFEQ